MKIIARAASCMLLLAAAITGPAAAAPANTLCVNHGGTDGCYGTLAAAVAAAGVADTVHIVGAGGPYFERVTITTTITLLGDGPSSTILDGAAGGQVLRLIGPATVTLKNLTLRNGQSGAGNVSTERGGGIHAENIALILNNVVVSGNHTGGGNVCCGGVGGGIYVDHGSLTLINSTVSGNGTGSGNTPSGGSGGGGGGIFAQFAVVSLVDSRVLSNTTGGGTASNSDGGFAGNGGGLMLQSGSLTVTRSTISGNTTGDGGPGVTTGGGGGHGGGLFLNGLNAVIRDSTISGNRTGAGGAGSVLNGSSGSGGGLWLVGLAGGFAVTIDSSTFSNNATGRALASSSGGDGGGLFANAGVTVTLTNVTLAFNLRDTDQMGGGIASPFGTVRLKNSLLAHNVTAANDLSESECSGSITSLGYNVLQDPFCAITTTTGDQFFVGSGIVLPLAANGGPTLTNALVPGSVAVDTADNSACPPTDQRGFARPVFGGTAVRCDVGAYELYRYGSRLPVVER